MNKFKLVSALAMSMMFATGAAQAADATFPLAAGAASTYGYAVTTGKYVANTFQFSVSANVGMAVAEDTTSIAVVTANSKGRNNFSGSSNGGTVSTCGTATTGNTAPTLGTASLTAANGCGTTTGGGTGS